MRNLILSAVAVLTVILCLWGAYYRVTTGPQESVEIHDQHSKIEKKQTAPERAEKWRADAWSDENGLVSRDGLANAVAQRDAYLEAHSTATTDGFGNNGAARMNWLPIGPENVGGRTRSLVFNRFPPFQTPMMWAGAVSGGIWRSTNYGDTWSAMNGGLQNFAVNCMVAQRTSLNPRVQPTLWAGTGEGFSSNGLTGGGLFKSTDGGLSWARIRQSFENKWINIDSLAITKYLNPDTQEYQTVMLAGVENVSNLGERGIMRSTNGEDWEQVYDAVTSFSIVFDPNDPNGGKVVAEVRQPREQGDDLPINRVVYSTKAGERLSWVTATRPNYSPTSTPTVTASPTPSPTVSPNGTVETNATPTGSPTAPAFETNAPEKIVKLVYSASEPGVVYASEVGTYFPPHQISKSFDGGRTYSKYNLTGVPEYNSYKSLFWVSPTNGNLMIAGGTQLFRSTDGGVNFERIAQSGDIGNIPHDDMQNAVNSPNQSTKVYVMNDGGIFRADNIMTAVLPSPTSTPTPPPTSTSSGWREVNQTYQTTQFFRASGDGNIVSGGTQDNGTLRVLSGNRNSKKLHGGDGGGTAVDGNFCVGQANGGLYRNSNCAAGMFEEEENLTETGISDYEAPGYGVPWVAPMKIDQTNPDRFFFGASSVWLSRNIQDPVSLIRWSAIKKNPVQPNPSGSPYRPVEVTAMDVHPTNPNIVWVAETKTVLPGAADYGGLYKTENALATPNPTATAENPVIWQRVDNHTSGTPTPTTSPLPDRKILKILIDPANSQRVYVGFSGHPLAIDNLYRTTNGGNTWHDISGDDDLDCLPRSSSTGLPCVPVNAIALDPRAGHSGTVYVGTDIGLYVTYDVNASHVEWLPITNGPANVKVSDLNFIKGTNKLLAATYGRGLWVADLGARLNPHATNDFDGDGRSDLAVVREDSAHKDWHIQGSSEAYRSQEFGNRDDQVAAADYDGDGKTDVAVYRGTEQKFYCLRSSDNTLAVTQINAQNATTAQTAVADFDGDDLADEAVFDSYTGRWTVEQSSEGHLEFNWGEPNDNPVAADFNDDGQADFGVYHEANGMITLSYTANGEQFQKQFGLEGDVPVPGEYDGDKVIDLAVWRADDDGEGNGCWYITYGANGYEGLDAIPWGETGDIPAPGDYDGDGKLDIAVFRPGTGMWHILQSSNGYYSERFGADGDKPVGVKAVYASRGAGNGTFTKAPDWAEPKRRVEKPRVSEKETQMAD